MTVVVDIVIVLLVIFFTWHGCMRGFILGVSGIVVLIASFYAATYVSDNYSGEFSKTAAPYLNGIVDQAMAEPLDGAPKTGGADLTDIEGDDDELYTADGTETGKEDIFSVTFDSFRRLGLPESTASDLANSISESMKSAGDSIKSAVIGTLVEKISYVLLFLLTFFGCMLALSIIVRVINGVFNIPGLNLVNRTGGAVLGLLKGLLLLYAVAFLFRYTGAFLPEGLLESTVILKFMVQFNPIATLLGM